MNDEDLLDKYGLLTQSNAPKKAVTETDELLSKYGLSPKDIQEPKQMANPEWWKGKAADSSYEGVAKKFGIGMARGAKDVLDTAAHGLGEGVATIAEKVLPTNVSAPIRASVEQMKSSDLTGRNEFNKEYPSNEGILPTSTDVGRFAGQVAATAPVMPARAFQGIAAASKALPTTLATGGQVAAPIANRLVSAVGQGALGGAVFNAATSSTNDKSLAENVGEGALTGGLAGPLAVGATSAGKNLASRVVGKISPERAELARKAADHGIDLEAGQVSSSPLWKKFNQVTGWVPLSGAQAASDKQMGQFTKAVSRTMGQDSANITPDVIKAAKTDLGHNYETVARNTEIRGDSRLAHDFAKVVQNANQVISDPHQLATFHNQLNNILNKFENGKMTGEQWQAMRKTTEPLSTIANANKNTTLGQSVKGLIVSMDAAFNRSAPQDMQALLQKTNSQYKSMKTVEKLANSDAEGQVSPMKLMSKIVNSPYGGKSGAGQLGDLADIGRAFFPKPADSGTPLGEAILDKIGPSIVSPSTAVAGGVGALVGGLPIIHGAEALAGAVANRYVRKGINSATVRNAIINSAQGANYGKLDRAVEKTVPYSSNLLENRDHKEKFKLPVALSR